MEYNVVQLLKERIGETRDYEIEDDSVDLDDEELTGINGHVRLTRTHDGVLADARLTMTAPEQCARCLIPFSSTVPMHIEEVYLPTVDMHTGQQLAAPEDPEAFLIDDHHILDLREPVRQYRFIEEEFAPLCRPDCLGLCPVCGIDRNQLQDHHHDGDVDSRWSALAELAGRLNTE